MPETEATPEEKVVKAWMRELLAKSGLQKAPLAKELGVSRKTITNTFSDEASLPRGLTLYRLLQELGGLRDDAPGQTDTLSDRLARLEVETRTTRRLVAEALRLQEFERELEGELQQLREDPPQVNKTGTDG